MNILRSMDSHVRFFVSSLLFDVPFSFLSASFSILAPHVLLVQLFFYNRNARGAKNKNEIYRDLNCRETICELLYLCIIVRKKRFLKKKLKD